MRVFQIIGAALAFAFFSVTGAVAADLTRYIAPPVPYTAPTTFNQWTGPYGGIVAGYSWEKMQIGDDTVQGQNDAFVTKPKGLDAGVTLGFNQQYGAFVVGLEADVLKSWQTAKTETDWKDFCNKYGLVQTSSLDWLATFDVRAGYLVMPNFLLYGKVGLAGGESTLRFDLTTTPNHGQPWTDTASITGAGVGINYGLGGEYIFAPGWSAKLEWNHYDLTNLKVAVNSTSGKWTTDGNIVKVGINRFF